MKKLIIFLIHVICASNFTNAQSLDSVVRHAANNFLASGSRAGFSVGVIKNDSIYQYNFGSVRKNEKQPPTNNTIYEIGSVTKTFTSLLLAKAVSEHKVRLSDDIRKYLKGNYPNLQYNGKPIQLLHLANLTSGLPDNLPEKLPEMKALNPDSEIFRVRDFHNSYTKTQFLADVHLIKLSRAPGINPAHSNTAAELLGFLLENIYRETYEMLVKNYITGPLQMGSTFVFVPASKQPLYAPGYNDKGTLMPDIPRDAGSAGVLKSSLADMTRYMKSQLEEKDKVILMSHKPNWGDPGKFAVGLNWSIKINFDGNTKIWTSGGTFGQSCYICLYPGRKFGIVILTNENDNQAEDKLSDMAQTIYNETYFTAFQRSFEGFGFSRSINILLDSLNKNNFKNAIKLADDLKKNIPSFKLFEDEVNLWGYSFFFREQKAKALEIFKLNVSLYPASPNTYDSLAETYESMGDKSSAIENYKKELKLDPKNSDVAEHLKKLEESGQ